MQKANEFHYRFVINNSSSTLGGLDAIDSPEDLDSELKKDDLLKRDVYSVVKTVSSYLPCLGFLSGGTTTAKHIYGHKIKPEEAPNHDQ